MKKINNRKLKVAYKKPAYKRTSPLFGSKKTSYKKKKLRLGNSAYKRRMLVFVLIFGAIGAYALWRIFAATPAPTAADEVVLDYRVEAANMTKKTGDLQPLEYANQPIKVRILGDGTIYCSDVATDKVKEGKLSRTEVESYYDQVVKTGVGKLANDIAPGGTKDFSGDYTGIIIGSTGNAKRVNVYQGASKPKAFVRSEQILVKACVKATKQILRSEARAPKAPKLVAAAPDLLGKTIAALSPKVSAATDIYQEETSMFNLTNQRRAAVGINGLYRSGCLTNAAREWASYMANNYYFAHSDLVTLVNRHCGSAWSALGENVGVGYGSQTIFNAYMSSCGHKGNIESRYPCDNGLNTRPWGFTGIGYAVAADGRNYTSSIFAYCPGCAGGWTEAPYIPQPAAQSSMRGNVDANTCSSVSGWSYDTGDLSRRVAVHVYFANPDGSGQQGFETFTDGYRGDVNAAFGISGNHGFSYAVPAFWAGRAHKTTVYAIGTNGVNPIIGGGTVDNCSPVGNVDIRDRCDVVAGWAFQRGTPSQSIDVHVYLKRLDGSGMTGYNTGPTSVYRGDVNAAYGIAGNHGFSWKVPAEWAKTPHIAEIYAIGTGGSNPLLATTSVSYCGGIGNVDINRCSNIQGWAIDKAATDATVELHVYFYNPDGSGREVLGAYTSVYRGDVNSAYGVGGNHGFSYTVPSQWANKAHIAHVYAISPGGNAFIGGGNCTF